jgi:hypothetical protein
MSMNRMRRQPYPGLSRPFEPSLHSEFDQQAIDTLEAIAHTLTAIDHNLELGVQALQRIASSVAAIAHKQ